MLTTQHPEYKRITEQLATHSSSLRDIQHAPKLSALKQVSRCACCALISKMYLYWCYNFKSLRLHQYENYLKAQLTIKWNRVQGFFRHISYFFLFNSRGRRKHKLASRWCSHNFCCFAKKLTFTVSYSYPSYYRKTFIIWETVSSEMLDCFTYLRSSLSKTKWRKWLFCWLLIFHFDRKAKLCNII